MTPIDWAIAGVVALSMLLGLLRGLLRELLSLAGWIAGALLALRYASALGRELPLDLWPYAETALAALAIVLGCVFTSAIIAWVLRQLLVAVKLSGVDRVLGGVFGFLRGVLIVAIAVGLTRGTTVSKQPFWAESVLLPHVGRTVEAAVRWMAPVAPSATPAVPAMRTA
jgi:membrane protein required for colicin V production